MAQSGIERAFSGVVSVFPQWPANIRRSAEPEASGVALGDGRLIVTAAHVVAKALSVQIRTADGEIAPATLAGIDQASDLALLRLDVNPASIGIRPMPIAARPPRLGEPTCAIGNAFGLDLSVTCGVISALNRAGTGFNTVEDFIQTDASVNPGASGGALVNRDGELIGVLSAIFTKQSDANIGVNFAVSIDLMQRVVDDLAQSGRVNYPDLGLSLSSRVLSSFGGRVGAFVLDVGEGSVAELAGLQPGQVIVKAAGRRIRKPEDFEGLIASLKLPAEVDIETIDHKTLHRAAFKLRFDAASPIKEMKP